jgi:very-short-patch-repair endonuclease
MSIQPDFFRNSCGKPHPLASVLADLAAGQHGVVAVWQLWPLGFTDDQIQYWSRTGRLHRIHRGVYAVGHARVTGDGRWMAAALAHGPLAVLSHRTAAAVHALLRSSSPTAHVTVPARGRRSRKGIVLHQVPLDEDERTMVDGLPVTTVARTLLDLASANDPLLARAVEEAEHLRLLDVKAIDLEARRPGVRRLRRALEIYRSAPSWTRSEFERRVLEAVRKAGLPAPSVNVWVLGAERDLVWFDLKVVVELDGPWHQGTAAQIRDPLRDATLQLKDWKVLRVPQHWFDTDPAGVVRTIGEYLSRAARTPARPGR